LNQNCSGRNFKTVMPSSAGLVWDLIYGWCNLVNNAAGDLVMTRTYPKRMYQK